LHFADAVYECLYVSYASLSGADYFDAQHWPVGICIGHRVLCEERTKFCELDNADDRDS
jgi:hypothetical protein